MCIFLVGCSSGINSEEQMKMAINNMTMPFASGAISLHIIPSAKMNAWNDIANSSVMLILQANEKGVLQNVMNDPVIIKQIFDDAGSFDGILKIDRYVAMPGQNTTLHIDRSEKARHVSIISGYYPFPAKQHMLLVDIPITITKQGWLHKKWNAVLSSLEMKILLGQETIQKVHESSESK